MPKIVSSEQQVLNKNMLNEGRVGRTSPGKLGKIGMGCIWPERIEMIKRGNWGQQLKSPEMRK